MGWTRTHEHDWQWAVDSNAHVLSLVLPGVVVFGWQVCGCGQWRVRILKEQRSG